MKTIRDYLESLFLGVPESLEKDQLKADLMANMEDRYEELISEGKGEHEAIGITITEFGSIDELLADLEILKDGHQQAEPADDNWHDAISREEAFAFLEIYRRSALKIGLGVLLILLSVSQLILLSEMYAEYVGLFLLFILIGCGVGLFIVAGMAITNVSKSLDDRPIPRNVAQEVSTIKNDYRRSFAASITIGVLIIIFSVGLLFIGAMMGGDGLGVSMMLFGIGFGVTLLVYGGMVQGSFEKLTSGRIFVADEDQPGPRARQAKNLPPFIVFLNGIYWPIVVAIFLIGGFIFHAWSISWIVFPIAGVLYGSIQAAVER